MATVGCSRSFRKGIKKEFFISKDLEKTISSDFNPSLIEFWLQHDIELLATYSVLDGSFRSDQLLNQICIHLLFLVLLMTLVEVLSAHPSFGAKRLNTNF